MFWQSEPFTEQITTMDNYKLNRLSMTGIENWTTGWTASIPLSGQKKPSQRFFLMEVRNKLLHWNDNTLCRNVLH